MNNTKRKAKVQGVLRRAKQRFKKGIRHRYSSQVVTDSAPALSGRYKVINRVGLLVDTFKDENAALDFALAQTKLLNFCTVEDRGPNFDFVPTRSIIA